MPSSTRTTTYEGYAIERGPDGNYRVRTPRGEWWPDPAVNLATAKQWIHYDQAERRAHAARHAKGGNDAQ